MNTAIALSNSKFDLITFTGSTEKGKLIAQAAAKNLVPYILELGGKSPLIVDVTANETWAAKKTLYGKLMNYGQLCIAPDYIFCHESKLDGYLKALKKQYKVAYNNCKQPEYTERAIN